MRRRLACALALVPCACSTEYAQIAADPGAGGASSSASCPSALADRLTITSVKVDSDIRYKRPGYDLFPADERIALARASDDSALVAWLDNALDNVHVTPLDHGFQRAGSDSLVPGTEISGLVAHPDGFALLVRGSDPGDPPVDPNGSGDDSAALLVVQRGGAPLLPVALTGTLGLGAPPEDHRHDCVGFMHGALAFNGQKYGAHFQSHGCVGNFNASFYTDKLVYVDPSGAFLEGGWDDKCSIDEDLRLLPGDDTFTALCMSSSVPFRGLNLLTTDPPRLLAEEFTTDGYCAGKFGSVVRLDDGSFVIAWLSRGPAMGSGNARQASKQANDIALVRLAADYQPLGPITWVTDTPDVAEINLHLARYGPNRLLLIWESFDQLRCSSLTCFGQRQGTYARLIDAAGNYLSESDTIDAPPNSADDLVVFSNGDVGWAFVPESDRSYSAVLPSDNGVPAVPAVREIRIARLRYCE
jgi:hypothetical protein